MGDLSLLANFLLRIHIYQLLKFWTFALQTHFIGMYSYRKVDIISVPTRKSTILLKEKVSEFVYVVCLWYSIN